MLGGIALLWRRKGLAAVRSRLLWQNQSPPKPGFYIKSLPFWIAVTVILIVTFNAYQNRQARISTVSSSKTWSAW